MKYMNKDAALSTTLASGLSRRVSKAGGKAIKASKNAKNVGNTIKDIAYKGNVQKMPGKYMGNMQQGLRPLR